MTKWENLDDPMSLKLQQRTSSQNRGISKHDSPPRAFTAKITTKLQNSYHPELSENPGMWMSDDQRIKEITFIQMGRRSGDVETLMGSSTSTYGG